MFVVVWEFRVKPGGESEFERHYSANGTWAELFRRDPAYQGTDLLRDRTDPQRYVTLDRWADAESYEKFLAAAGDSYKELDRQMEGLTVGEQKMGAFTTVK
jgi:heme-degrading monooxygenase HmoA